MFREFLPVLKARNWKFRPGPMAQAITSRAFGAGETEFYTGATRALFCITTELTNSNLTGQFFEALGQRKERADKARSIYVLTFQTQVDDPLGHTKQTKFSS